MESIKLFSGNTMPKLGLGTWQLTGNSCKNTVKKAIELGYTHIDTAWVYNNQNEIGEALKEIDKDRKDLFITSKVWRDSLSYNDLINQCNQTLKQLNTDYLDLYLIHWPNKSIPIKDTLKAFKKLADDNKVKSFGVSNFTISHLKEALEFSYVPIDVNQVEFHPFLFQKELLEFCKEKNIVLTAYSPLARGKVVSNSTLSTIAKKHNKTPAQVSLRWLLEKGLIVIPKASSEEHIKENKDIFSWSLEKDDIQKIDSLDKVQREVDPDFAEF